MAILKFTVSLHVICQFEYLMTVTGQLQSTLLIEISH